MQPQTYTQLLEIFTCMGVYNARVYNFKDNPKEVAQCAGGLKEMAEDLRHLGAKWKDMRRHSFSYAKNVTHLHIFWACSDLIVLTILALQQKHLEK